MTGRHRTVLRWSLEEGIMNDAKEKIWPGKLLTTKPGDTNLTIEERHIIDVIKAARQIQEFLWSDMNDESGLEEFRRMFRKRVAKIESISMDNPHWRVELNKRLLQTAAICVNLMAKNATGRLTHAGVHPTMPSNLPEYATRFDSTQL
jgi:hypothetical protein